MLFPARLFKVQYSPLQSKLEPEQRAQLIASGQKLKEQLSGLETSLTQVVDHGNIEMLHPDIAHIWIQKKLPRQ